MSHFVFSKCPNCQNENQSNWVDLIAVKPGAKIFRSVKPSTKEQQTFVVTCRHCHTAYKITVPPQEGDSYANA